MQDLTRWINFYYDDNDSFDSVWALGVKGKQEVMDKLKQNGIKLTEDEFKL